MKLMKINSTVRFETVYIAAWVIVCSALLEAIFLIIGKWDYTVILGNLLSGSAAVLNFLFMGITVQKAVDMEQKKAAHTIKISQSLRTLFLFVVAAIGVALSCFNIFSALIPLFFPRIAIAFRPLFWKNKK